MKIISYLNPRARIVTGVELTDSGLRYVTVARFPNGKDTVVAMGEDLRGVASVVRPAIVTCDLGTAPVRFIREKLAEGEDPDLWIDRNEERLIPQGVGSEMITDTWAVEQDTIYAAAVRRDNLAVVRERVGKSVELTPISVPLWCLGMLYGTLTSEPFLLWRLESGGSVAGLVEKEKLVKLCSFWAGTDDLSEAADDVLETVRPVLTSLGGDKITKVIVVGATLSAECIRGYECCAPPAIPGIAPKYHQAYAQARFAGESDPDFSSAASRLDARRYARSRNQALRVVQIGSGSVVGAFGLLLVALAVIAGFRMQTNKKIAPLEGSIVKLREKETRLDSLSKSFLTRAQFLGRESSVTAFLADLQDVFPDQSWTGRIAVGEASTREWRIEIDAYAYSTALVPEVVSRLNRVPGMRDVRMQYSEQTRVNGRSSVRFRVVGTWRSGPDRQKIGEVIDG